MAGIAGALFGGIGSIVNGIIGSNAASSAGKTINTAATGVAQDAAEGVAENGVAQMADVRGFIGIDAGVLDHHLGRVRRVGHRSSAQRLFARGAEKRRAVQKEIEVAAAGDFDPRDAFRKLQGIRDFLREGARRIFQALGQLEAERRSDFAHGQPWRAPGDHGDVRLVALVEVYPSGGGEYMLSLKSGRQLPVGPSYPAAIRAALLQARLPRFGGSGGI